MKTKLTQALQTGFCHWHLPWVWDDHEPPLRVPGHDLSHLNGIWILGSTVTTGPRPIKEIVMEKMDKVGYVICDWEIRLDKESRPILGA